MRTPDYSFSEHDYYRQQQPALRQLRWEANRLAVSEGAICGSRGALPADGHAYNYDTAVKRLNPQALLGVLGTSWLVLDPHPQPANDSDSETYDEQREADEEIGHALYGLRAYLWHKLEASSGNWSREAINLATAPSDASYSGVSRYVAEMDYDISLVTLDILRPDSAQPSTDARLYQTATYHTIFARKSDIAIATTSILTIDGHLRHIDYEDCDETGQNYVDGFYTFPDPAIIDDLTTDLSTLH